MNQPSSTPKKPIIVDQERINGLKATIKRKVDFACHPKHLDIVRKLLTDLEHAYTSDHTHKFTSAGFSDDATCDICGIGILEYKAKQPPGGNAG